MLYLHLILVKIKSLSVILSRNIVQSVLYLILVFFLCSLLFIYLGADFIGLIIYFFNKYLGLKICLMILLIGIYFMLKMYTNIYKIMFKIIYKYVLNFFIFYVSHNLYNIIYINEDDLKNYLGWFMFFFSIHYFYTAIIELKNIIIQAKKEQDNLLEKNELIKKDIDTLIDKYKTEIKSNTEADSVYDLLKKELKDIVDKTN